MEMRRKLSALSRPVLVEVVYLCGRYLTHGMSRESFLRQLDSDMKTKHREQSVEVVLDVVSAIEEREGHPVRDLSMAIRFAYAGELDDILWEQVEVQTSDAEVQSALAAFESQ